MSFPDFPKGPADKICMIPIAQQLIGIVTILTATVSLFTDLTERTHLYGVKKLIEEIEKETTDEAKEKVLKEKSVNHCSYPLKKWLKEMSETNANLKDKIFKLRIKAKVENTQNIKMQLIIILIGFIRIVPIVSTVYSYRQWKKYKQQQPIYFSNQKSSKSINIDH
jgi:hypothetical protein